MQEVLRVALQALADQLVSFLPGSLTGHPLF